MGRRHEQRAMRLVGLCLLGVAVFMSVLFFVRKKWAGNDLSAPASSGSEVTSDSRTQAGLPSAPDTFDPNTADSVTLVSLGLSSWQAHNVLRYRQKGGVYHRPEDFMRLYGMTVKQWERLEPRIRIGRSYRYLADVEDLRPSYPRPSYSRPTAAYYSKDSDMYVVKDSALHSTHPFRRNAAGSKLREGETVDLSLSDTAQLQRIPGIGSVYARRIAAYRERLGGFVSLRQLNDDALSFLPTGIEAYLSLSGGSVRKLRINTLSVRELANHPYISYPQARQLNTRIRTVGPVTSWEEILFLSEFSDSDRQRLEPYVEF